MSETYTVVRGDTLSGIARRHGIRYWPNLYLATENNAFRALRSNPDRIQPGDVVRIPPREKIAPMERQPTLIHRDLPLFTQSAETCWRATGKMLYLRRHRVSTAEADFGRRIGQAYRDQETGLQSANWSDFYVRTLGMTETIIASPGDLQRAIAEHGPVIAAVGDDTSAHSMVIAGYDIRQGRWMLVDPAAGQEMTFAPMAVTASGEADVDNGAVLTDFQTGPATWESMAAWRGIFEVTVHQRIFHY